MPELPEVETIARQLKADIGLRELRALKVFDTKLNDRRLSKLANLKLGNVSRVGKQILLCFSTPDKKSIFLAVHLRMSGRLIWAPVKSSANIWTRAEIFSELINRQGLDIGSAKHIRAVLFFKGGLLAFVDPRRFGTMKLSTKVEEFNPAGVDPLSEEFQQQYLNAELDKSTQPLKHWLLRQDRIVGLGNIYASEILFESRINPFRQGKTLSVAEKKLLFIQIRKVLRKAIKHCGTTFSDFQDSRGVSGSYQKYLKVYNRQEQQCYCCKAEILRIVQQGRSTFYCDNCQI